MYINHVNNPLFRSDFQETSILSTNFRKILTISSFMKLCPVGGQAVPWGRTEGKTERQMDRRTWRS